MTERSLRDIQTFKPRDWQRRALDVWQRCGRRGVMSVVTGGGKTRLAEMCIQSFFSEVEGGRVAVVVPTLALVDQWVVSLEEDLGVARDEIAIFAGGAVPTAGTFSIFTLVSARVHAPSVAQFGPTLLIADECHRIGSPRNAEALFGDYAATLGLSATPERDSDNAFEEIVAPVLGPVIFTYGYEEARADGVVAPFDLVNVRVDLLDYEKEDYDALTRRVAQLFAAERRGEDVELRVKRLLQQRATVSAAAAMRVPVTVALADRHRGQRLIVFHEQIAAADRIVAALRERGHNATVYHSKLAQPLRQENLRLYRKGIFEVLVTCRALDEGVNVPETRVAIVGSSTGSIRQRIQRLGRVLRPAPNKDRALIYTLFATEQERRRLEADEERGVTGADTIRWFHGKAPQ